MEMPKDYRIALWVFVSAYVRNCLKRSEYYRGHDYYATKTFHALERLLSDEDGLRDFIKDEEDSPRSIDFDYGEQIETMKNMAQVFKEEIEAFEGAS
ncbi:MAG: hypothetical protein SWE60_25020 [Thermodesulfobacteriota bacterium]|nr:hypothetical protein [Thermodesulfobacteriota bacterium]